MLTRRMILPVLIALSLAACGASELPSNDRLIDTFQQGRTGVWVSGHGPVTQVPGDETGADPHQRFIVRISDDLTVMVRHSLSGRERIPAGRGDLVAFHGRYEWNARGGVVSQTHRDGSQPGGGGWIELGGRRYD